MEEFHIEVYRGDTPEIEFVFYDAENNPLNLDGYTVYFTAIKPNGEVLFDVETRPVDLVNGKVSAKLTSEQTSVPGIYRCEFEGRKDDTILTLWQGWLVIRDDVRK